ncbi:MAG: ATP-binding cassette domain-containing protein [Chlorobi bacterium]|nr:ATP-binding cassette domain-containing protein [Chlorobiota bacterium]
MILIKDIYKSFSDSIKPFQGVNLNVNLSETLVLLGKSGSGKSVLLKCIVGLILPEYGSILVEDTEVVNAKLNVLNEIRKKVGYVFQSGALYDSLTVGENLAFPLEKTKGLNRAEIKDKVGYYLEQVGLPDKINTMPSELSGGQRKRIGVARTIITEPAYLLYDEPTTGLDPLTTKEIAELIIELQNKFNITSIVVTHDPYCLDIVADRVAFIDYGKIEFEGTKLEAQKSSIEFLKVFFGLGG